MNPVIPPKKNRKEQRHRDAQHREVDVGFAEPPVGCGPSPAARGRDRRRRARGVPATLVDLEAAKEALQALVVRFHPGLAAKAGGQIGEADAAHIQQGQQELGEEVEPRPVPGQVFG